MQGRCSMNSSVLVLNANFEPINVTNIYRAINLMMCHKATLIQNGRGTIRSVNASFPIPSVIRLQNMVIRPRQTLSINNREIFRRDCYQCQYCGKFPNQLTVDHVIPKHLGGKHIWENVVTACPQCNHRKGGKTIEEAHMSLLHDPKLPPSSAYYRFGRYVNDNQEWRYYLQNW